MNGPSNLFVAGFIGSPAMNFLPARRAGGRLELPVGSLDLPETLRARLAATDGPLVAGFRPEHLQVVTGQASKGLNFEAQADVVEWLGNDLVVYFAVPASGFDVATMAQSPALDAGDRDQCSLVARIAPDTDLKQGERVRLCLQPDDVEVFDAAGGRNLGLDAGGADSPGR